MPNIKKLFPSKYVKAADLEGRPRRVAIAGVEVEPIGREKDLKPVLTFRSSELKPMVLNMTNSRVIAAAFGDETDGWAGRVIELYPSETSFGSEVVECIRIRIPKQAEPPTKRAAIDEEPQPPDDGFEPMSDEQLPF